MDSSLNRSEYRASNTLQSFKLPAGMRGRNGINARNRNFAPAILQFLEKNLALIRVILVNAGRMPAARNKLRDITLAFDAKSDPKLIFARRKV
jgi:hypothetical protein